ncbi:hypothetical protein [Kibdelosporangium philippinense]|uniref:hypothetical protein n=1 Tax=Kibdelosporangium philippinense TaxID=211113 RepID=UPI003612B82F
MNPAAPVTTTAISHPLRALLASVISWRSTPAERWQTWMDDSGPRGVGRGCRTVPRDELLAIAIASWTLPSGNSAGQRHGDRISLQVRPRAAVPALLNDIRKSGTTNRVDVVRNNVGDTQCQPEATVRHE